MRLPEEIELLSPRRTILREDRSVLVNTTTSRGDFRRFHTYNYFITLCAKQNHRQRITNDRSKHIPKIYRSVNVDRALLNNLLQQRARLKVPAPVRGAHRRA